MTKGDRRNKREYDRKLKSQGGAATTYKPDGASNKSGSGQPRVKNTVPGDGVGSAQDPQRQQPGDDNVQVEQVVATPANSEQQVLPAGNDKDGNMKSESAKYAKRVIESNWSKYEMPPSDEEEEVVGSGGMTGADFNYVLASAQGAESHFRLKAEKEWERAAESLGELSQEFFCLDLDSLERSLATIPLHTQIGLAEEEVEAETLARFLRNSEAAKVDFELGVNVPEKQRLAKEEASQRMMAALTLGNSSIKPTTNPSANISLAGKTSSSSTSAKEPHGITSTDLSLDTNPSHQLKQFSVEQSENKENDDLDFLDNILDSVSTNRGSEENVEGEEKKDLDDEEWLDEFLGD